MNSSISSSSENRARENQQRGRRPKSRKQLTFLLTPTLRPLLLLLTPFLLLPTPTRTPTPPPRRPLSTIPPLTQILHRRRRTTAPSNTIAPPPTPTLARRRIPTIRPLPTRPLRSLPVIHPIPQERRRREERGRTSDVFASCSRTGRREGGRRVGGAGGEGTAACPVC